MIWSLQTLRFVAAMMIVYVHAAQTAFAATGSNGLIPHELQIAGRAGVDIFFVISGVIITVTARNLTWQQFAWKRFRRIIPIYILACIPAVAIAGQSADLGWRDIVATFLLWPATDVMTAPLLPVAWTLCFEMVFYASAALVLVDRRALPLLLGLFVMAFSMRTAGPLFQFLGNPIIVEFLFGAALTFAPAFRLGRLFLPLGFALIVLTGPFGIAPAGGTLDFLTGEENGMRVLTYGLPSAMIVYGAMQYDARPSVWTYLGDGSYSLYLFHTFAISALFTVWVALPLLPPDVIILVGSSAALLLCWRLYERVEKPVLATFRRKSAIA